jgi:hypothetical protein
MISDREMRLRMTPESQAREVVRDKIVSEDVEYHYYDEKKACISAK